LGERGRGALPASGRAGWRHGAAPRRYSLSLSRPTATRSSPAAPMGPPRSQPAELTTWAARLGLADGRGRLALGTPAAASVARSGAVVNCRGAGSKRAMPPTVPDGAKGARNGATGGPIWVRPQRNELRSDSRNAQLERWWASAVTVSRSASAGCGFPGSRLGPMDRARLGRPVPLALAASAAGAAGERVPGLGPGAPARPRTTGARQGSSPPAWAWAIRNGGGPDPTQDEIWPGG
jgi:hypothetical protein